MTTHPDHTFAPSRWRRIFCSLFLIAAAATLVGATASSRAGGQSQRAVGGVLASRQKIARSVMNTQPTDSRLNFVVLVGQADLSPAANLPTKTEKGRFVCQTLLEKPQSTQEPILQWLRERAIEHRSFYIVNAILVK